MHNKAGIEGGLSLDTLSSYCDTNPVASSWLAFYDDCEGQVRNTLQVETLAALLCITVL